MVSDPDAYAPARGILPSKAPPVRMAEVFKKSLLSLVSEILFFML
jgi:hypothetical protein